MNFFSRVIGKLQRIRNEAKLAAKAHRILQRFPDAAPGSPDWLVGSELKYGGFVTNVPRNKVSPNDPRSSDELRRGGMTGGDRMLHNEYADAYSRFLTPLVRKGGSPTLMEVGILQGTGLAIWCDLFPNGPVIGCDIDLSHVEANMANLKSRGAFKTNAPELHVFDQLADGPDRIAAVLNGRRVDVCIDDGLHSDEAIVNTLRAVAPHLADEFVYFIEDNGTAAATIERQYPEFVVERFGMLTVVSPGR